MFYEYMLEFGFKKNDIDRIVKTVNTEYSDSIRFCNKVDSGFEFLLNVGYTKEQVIKMVKLFPKLLDLKALNFNKKIEELLKLGFTMEQIIKMTVTFPRIYSMTIDNIKNKIKHMSNLGYDENSIKSIMYSFPNILSCSNETMSNKFNELMFMGYSREQIVNMTTLFPNMYSLSIDNIREKIVFYDFLGISDFILERPRFLMQSVELSYARYMFFKSSGIEITMDNFLKLFMSAYYFKLSYRITNDDILKMYKYDKDVVKRRRRKMASK